MKIIQLRGIGRSTSDDDSGVGGGSLFRKSIFQRLPRARGFRRRSTFSTIHNADIDINESSSSSSSSSFSSKNLTTKKKNQHDWSGAGKQTVQKDAIFLPTRPEHLLSSSLQQRPDLTIRETLTFETEETAKASPYSIDTADYFCSPHNNAFWNVEPRRDNDDTDKIIDSQHDEESLLQLNTKDIVHETTLLDSAFVPPETVTTMDLPQHSSSLIQADNDSHLKHSLMSDDGNDEVCISKPVYFIENRSLKKRVAGTPDPVQLGDCLFVFNLPGGDDDDDDEDSFEARTCLNQIHHQFPDLMSDLHEIEERLQQYQREESFELIAADDDTSVLCGSRGSDLSTIPEEDGDEEINTSIDSSQDEFQGSALLKTSSGRTELDNWIERVSAFSKSLDKKLQNFIDQKNIVAMGMIEEMNEELRPGTDNSMVHANIYDTVDDSYESAANETGSGDNYVVSFFPSIEYMNMVQDRDATRMVPQMQECIVVQGHAEDYSTHRSASSSWPNLDCEVIDQSNQPIAANGRQYRFKILPVFSHRFQMTVFLGLVVIIFVTTAGDAVDQTILNAQAMISRRIMGSVSLTVKAVPSQTTSEHFVGFKNTFVGAWLALFTKK